MGKLSQNEFASRLGEHYAQLWTVAAAVLGDRHQADDVVQDAAMTGLKKIADYTPGTNFAAWMSQIVRFTALNHRKRRPAGNHALVGLHGVDEPAAKQSDGVPKAHDRGQLDPHQQWFDDCTARAINDLEPDRRACLLLRVVHELSYDEIATIVGVPAGTAMSHVHRAKGVLRQQLAAEFGVPTAKTETQETLIRDQVEPGSESKEPADG
ncbi:MAG: RNA polymerase sigma factor [Planctomycetota bacterium]